MRFAVAGVFIKISWAITRPNWLGLLFRWEHIDHSVHGPRRRTGVQRSEDEVAGLQHPLGVESFEEL